MTNSATSAQANREQGWFLETISGPLTGQRYHLSPRKPVDFGRRPGIGAVFPEDGHMSGLHFSAEFDGATCRVKDMQSRNGTFVNGTRIQETVLACNDLITAGATVFTLGFAGSEIAYTSVDEPGMASPQSKLLSLLRNNFQPLFAILDAARNRYALALLLQSHSRYQSLYEGPKGESLSNVAPYLVELPKDSDLLRTLAKEGWGQSWGVYLKCPAEFQEVRRHLRHFLEVRQPNGEQVYFRFYDPRVLRVYLTNLGPNDAGPFMGSVHCYLMEGQKPDTLLQFMNAGQGVVRAAIPLTVQHRNEADAATMPETYTAG